METFKFTDLSGVERTLSNEGGVAFEVSHTGTDDKLIEWVEDGTKLYCFVTADVANEIAASGLRLIKGGGSLLDLDEGDFRTQIFTDYEAFLAREDKDVNGVSPEHAEAVPNWEEDNKTNKGCWDCDNCTSCELCVECRYCTDCVSCSKCVECEDCSDCEHCSDSKLLNDAHHVYGDR